MTENEDSGQARPLGPPEPSAAPAGPAGAEAETEQIRQAESAAAETEPGEAAGERPGRLARYRLAFRGWRHTRPFWGGLLVVLGGGEILLTYRAPFGIILHFGLYGLAGYLVPAMLGVLGLLILFDPPHRTFYSVLAVLCALGTWLTSNLGGFFIGMLLGLVGGSLAFGWQVGERPEGKRRRVRARAAG